MNDDLTIPEGDVRAIVHLLGSVARGSGPLLAKRPALMDGLCKLVDAEAWSWIISRASDSDNNPAVGVFLHGGMTREQFATYAQIMQDRENPPIEYGALNELRRHKTRFTRSWDQLVTEAEWYSPKNLALLKRLGFEHVLYSVKVLDKDGLFSGIALKRKMGREKFTPLQRRIVHVVTSEVNWLHYDGKIASLTKDIRPLPARLRMVLTLLVEGFTVREIADELGRSYYTINDRMKEIHRHFHVKNRVQLVRRFTVGDGEDVE